MERGQYGIKLYRIPDTSLLTGATPWQMLTTVDTSLTGYEANFLPGFVRDMYGNLIPGSGIQLYHSISDPPPPWNASPATAGTSGGHCKLEDISGCVDAQPSLDRVQSILQPNLTRGHDGMDRSQWRVHSAINPRTSLPKSATGRDGPFLWLQGRVYGLFRLPR